MAKASLYDHTGKQLSEVSLPKDLFEVKVSPVLMAQAVHVYRSNSHQGSSAVQGRGEVNRTTAKWYKQKGTGRARHGARSAPLFVGGGVAFGPRGLNARNLKLTQKMKKLSLLGALSGLKDSQISLISDLDKVSAKTKDLSATLVKMNVGKKPTLLVSQPFANVVTAAKNIKGLNIIPYSQANAYLILNTRSLIIDQKALELLEKWLVVKSKTPKVEEVTAVKPTAKKTVVKKAAVKKVVAKK